MVDTAGEFTRLLRPLGDRNGEPLVLDPSGELAERIVSGVTLGVLPGARLDLWGRSGVGRDGELSADE